MGRGSALMSMVMPYFSGAVTVGLKYLCLIW
jgi:hypothetical protein